MKTRNETVKENPAPPKGRVPRLRFPEFRGAGEWEYNTLGSIAERILEKVGTISLPTVSISAGIGYVLQSEKFGRDISGEQYKNYIKLNKGDFAYNKGNSKKYPQGCIYQLKEYECVAVPNAFISFRLLCGYIPAFFEGYFEQNRHGVQLKRFITSGARSDGLLNINVADFFSIKFFVPKIKEQQKIAACLSSLDTLIAAHGKKLENLKAYKKGLMQLLFPAEGEKVPRLRFPGFKGEWEEKQLLDLCSMRAGKFIAGSEIQEKLSEGLYPCYGGNGLRGYVKIKTHSGRYPLIGRQGALCGNIILASGQFYATEHAVVCTPYDGIDVNWLYYELNNLDLNRYSTGQAQPGLSVDALEKVSTIVPLLESEQQKIAAALSSLDELIAAQARKIEELKEHKRGLMQGLFPETDDEIHTS